MHTHRNTHAHNRERMVFQCGVFYTVRTRLASNKFMCVHINCVYAVHLWRSRKLEHSAFASRVQNGRIKYIPMQCGPSETLTETVDNSPGAYRFMQIQRYEVENLTLSISLLDTAGDRDLCIVNGTCWHSWNSISFSKHKRLLNKFPTYDFTSPTRWRAYTRT